MSKQSRSGGQPSGVLGTPKDSSKAFRAAVQKQVREAGRSGLAVPYVRVRGGQEVLTYRLPNGRFTDAGAIARFRWDKTGALEPATAPGVAAFVVSARQCKWPVGDPSSSEFRFCGGATDGSAYCDAHRRTAFGEEVVPTPPLLAASANGQFRER